MLKLSISPTVAPLIGPQQPERQDHRQRQEDRRQQPGRRIGHLLHDQHRRDHDMADDQDGEVGRRIVGARQAERRGAVLALAAPRAGSRRTAVPCRRPGSGRPGRGPARSPATAPARAASASCGPAASGSGPSVDVLAGRVPSRPISVRLIAPARGRTVSAWHVFWWSTPTRRLPVPTASPPPWRRSVCPERREFDVVTLREGPPAIYDWRDWHSVVEPLCRLIEREPADAYVIACASDPGIEAARATTTRPVFGVFRSAVAVAVARAERFGVIAIVDASKARHLAALRAMGLESRLAAEVALNVTMETLLEPRGGARPADRRRARMRRRRRRRGDPRLHRHGAPPRGGRGRGRRAGDRTVPGRGSDRHGVVGSADARPHRRPRSWAEVGAKRRREGAAPAG